MDGIEQRNREYVAERREDFCLMKAYIYGESLKISYYSDEVGKLTTKYFHQDDITLGFEYYKTQQEVWDYLWQLNTPREVISICTDDFMNEAELFVNTPCDASGGSTEILDALRKCGAAWGNQHGWSQGMNM